MPGRGSFVAPQNPALHREESLKQMEEHLQHAIDAARRGGITKDEVRETLDLCGRNHDAEPWPPHCMVWQNITTVLPLAR